MSEYFNHIKCESIFTLLKILQGNLLEVRIDCHTNVSFWLSWKWVFLSSNGTENLDGGSSEQLIGISDFFHSQNH